MKIVNELKVMMGNRYARPIRIDTKGGLPNKNKHHLGHKGNLKVMGHQKFAEKADGKASVFASERVILKRGHHMLRRLLASEILLSPEHLHRERGEFPHENTFI